MKVSKLLSGILGLGAILFAAYALQLGVRDLAKEPHKGVSTPPRTKGSLSLGDGLNILGPYTHENLSIFLISKREIEDRTEYITLEEGLADGSVLVSEVNEGGRVNTLHIENRSDYPLYLQAGDIVKGGKQDRTIAVDTVIPANSGRVSIAALCVEPGRWTPRARGGIYFDQAKAVPQASTLELKMAIRDLKFDSSDRQQAVWREVRKINRDICRQLELEIKNPSESLVRGARHRKVQKRAKEYIEALAGIVHRQLNVVGFAYAINGEIFSVDIYPNPSLFKKLWGKNLKGCALEAIAKGQKDAGKTPLVSKYEVLTFITQAEKGQARTKDVGQGCKLEQIETDKAVYFNSLWADRVIHKQYLRK